LLLNATKNMFRPRHAGAWKSLYCLLMKLHVASADDPLVNDIMPKAK